MNSDNLDTHGTKTHFARHARAFLALEEILSAQRGSEYGALVVGAGLNLPFATKYFDGNYEGFGDVLQTFEPFEVALLMQRAGLEWRLTVIDSNEQVCDAVASQQNLILHSDDNDSVSQTEWHNRYLARLIETNPQTRQFSGEEIRAVGRRLGISRAFSYLTPTEARRLLTPTTAWRLPLGQDVKSRITVIHDAAPLLQKRIASSFEMVICNNVLCNADEMWTSIVYDLHEMLKPEGLMVIGDCAHKVQEVKSLLSGMRHGANYLILQHLYGTNTGWQPSSLICRKPPNPFPSVSQ
ncbi:hypothetical protein HYU16_03605 [Candidatus Woesearchaeota archaeon]|nr:hypothetical protein [Candidatus Woesearchaeota archaeon]